MNDVWGLERRMARVERSLRRSRVAGATLAIALVLTSIVAMAPQQEPQELTLARLLLANVEDTSMVMLVAGPESSLVIQKPNGEEIARIGGPAARLVR